VKVYQAQGDMSGANKHLNDEVVKFFMVFDDHFYKDPTCDVPGDLDANISGFMRTISWSGQTKGEAIDFSCRRIVGGESKQWVTYDDGVRQLEPAKPFDSIRCASVLQQALNGEKQKKGR
jgi:hypothetical protein